MSDSNQQPTVSSESIYHGKIVSLRVDTVRLPDGKTAKREIVEHPGAVVMCALDDKQNVFFIKQYRKPVEQMLLELPAGTREPNEEPEATARRELAEEIGYTADTMRLLTAFYSSPGYSTEQLHVYLATGLHLTHKPTDTHEVSEVIQMPLAEATQRVMDGTICDGKSIIGIIFAARVLNEG